MRIDSALTLVCLGFAAACADNSSLPSAPSGMGEISRPSASITLQFPAEDPGPPFYTLVERTFVPHTDEWAPVIFVRDPACVPGNFNLLDQLAVPQAFGCQSTVSGHVTYKNGPPPIDLAPWQVLMRGAGAVPIWFVPWPPLQAALLDDALTLSELQAMPSLRKGTASMFEMTQQPGPMRPQGAGNGKIELVARGLLADGTSFAVELREMGVDQVSVLRHIDIRFR
jgi:hypothetical protein